jgi:hypothetical protein
VDAKLCGAFRDVSVNRRDTDRKLVNERSDMRNGSRSLLMWVHERFGIGTRRECESVSAYREGVHGMIVMRILGIEERDEDARVEDG